MKNALIVLAVLGLLGGGYYVMNMKNVQPAPAVENAMPVSGASEVEEMIASSETEKSFTLDSFEFGYDQKTLTVKKGDTVTITLTNSGKMIHDWIVDEFNGAKTKQIKNGETDSISFVANKSGTFEYYCSVGKHRQNGMVGKLIVE